jgi:hypothetical protein
MNTTGDLIKNLPTDNNEPNHKELYYVNTIFEKEKVNIKKIFYELKEVIMVSLLFVLLSISYIDVLIKKIYPKAGNTMILISIKAVIFAVVFYLLKNLHVLRK